MTSPTTMSGDLPLEARSISGRDAAIAVLRTLDILASDEDEHDLSKRTQSSLVSTTVMAQDLRALLWTISSAGDSPVYVTRLVNAAYRLIQSHLLPVAQAGIANANEFATFISERPSVSSARDSKAQRHPLLVHLFRLQMIGDCVHLPNGYWLPTPMRVVPLPVTHHWLLVGGRPSYALPQALRAMVRHDGVSRMLSRDPAATGVQLSVQTWDDWCGMIKEPIRTWSQRVLALAILRPITGIDVNFQYYAPGLGTIPGSRNRYRYSRWVDSPQRLPDGRYLARRQIEKQKPSYAVVEIRNAEAIAAGSLQLTEGDPRLLQYGVDALAGSPVKIAVSKGPTTWRFVNPRRLPHAVERLLTAIGQRSWPDPEKPYREMWEVASIYSADATACLSKLGIQLLEGGTPHPSTL